MCREPQKAKPRLTQARLGLRASQPVAKATGCENTEASFCQRHREQRKLACFSVSQTIESEFSVTSQAVQSFTTAC